MYRILFPFFVAIWIGAFIYAAIVVGQRIWARRGSGEWPITDGLITQVTIMGQGVHPSAHEECSASIEYQFTDAAGETRKGVWTSQSFPSEAKARDFCAREMPVGKKVAVKYSPKDPKISNLELDSWTYGDDRPLSLDI